MLEHEIIESLSSDAVGAEWSSLIAILKPRHRVLEHKIRRLGAFDTRAIEGNSPCHAVGRPPEVQNFPRSASRILGPQFRITVIAFLVLFYNSLKHIVFLS